MSEWISVKDRLPEEGQSVDCWVSSVRYGTKYRHADSIFNTDFNEMCFDHDDFSHYEKIESVTHWMPLPSPPKE
jgi:hypothetical protein